MGATIINEYIPKTLGRFQTRGAQTFQNSRSYIKILGIGRATHSKFHTEDIQKFVTVYTIYLPRQTVAQDLCTSVLNIR